MNAAAVSSQSTHVRTCAFVNELQLQRRRVTHQELAPSSPGKTLSRTYSLRTAVNDLLTFSPRARGGPLCPGGTWRRPGTSGPPLLGNFTHAYHSASTRTMLGSAWYLFGVWFRLYELDAHRGMSIANSLVAMHMS